MRKFGIIGYPLSHSFSPSYFAEKFQKEGIENCSYDSFPIEDIHLLKNLLQNNTELQGLNITIPYKKSVMPYLTFSSEAVKQVGACNCIKISGDQIIGFNTDVIGFEKSFVPQLQSFHNKALVLGTGGAAAAVAFVLQKLQIDFKFVIRQKNADGYFTYDDLNHEVLQQYTIVINTTPLGMYPNNETFPAIPYDYINGKHYFYDLVYNPAITLFLQKALEKGAAIKNGSDMLYIQAEESWRIWNEE